MASPQAGYKYLRTYQLATVIYDCAVIFCDRYIDKRSRTHDQMVQAGRSGKQNIAEGYEEKSLQGYIKLLGIARASHVELLEDFLDYARQHRIPVWPKDDPRIREFRDLRVVGDIDHPDHPDLPDLPENPEVSVNYLLTLLHQEIYLEEKQISSLEQKFIREGGFTENLFKKRLEYRKK